jgi:PTS system glucose-specific IIA component
MSLTVNAPAPGHAVPLAEVPDPVFAQALVGAGAAVDPPRRVVDVVAPIDGVLIKMQPHAFIVRGDDGTAILVHLGIDTVRLDGAPFTLRRETGETVRAGDVVTTWDVTAVEASGMSPVIPVIALEQPEATVHPTEAVAAKDEIRAGQALLTVG